MAISITEYKALSQSELFKEGPIVLFIWENQSNWPVLSVSGNISRLYGHRVEDLISGQLKYSELIHEEDLPRVFDEVQTNSIDPTIKTFSHQPYRLRRADGSYRWVHDSTIIIREGELITHYVGYISDVSEFKALQQKSLETSKKLQEHQALLESYKIAIDCSSIVTKTDVKGRITYANENFYRVTGYSKEEVIGKTHAIVRDPENSDELYKQMWKNLQAKKVWKGVLKNRAKEGYYWVDIAIVPILNANKEVVEYIATSHDITQMIEQKAKLDATVNSDLLTGLGSRYKLNKDIKLSQNPALALVDIDGFSQINDFFGHDNGDSVIKQLGEIINALIEGVNIEIYHLQGDEFVLFSSNMEQDRFVDIIKDINKEISSHRPVRIDGDEIYLRVSFGLSFESKSTLLATADMALKYAKSENKSIVVYNEKLSLNSEYKNNIKWTAKIKEAIEQDRFIPVFQPIVNNATGEFEKYEALIRLDDGDRLITPYHFLEISKKTKYYFSLTKIILSKSFEKFKDRQEAFSINLTVADIRNDEIRDFIVELLHRYGVGQRVVFEIVESESIESFEEVLEFIESVKAYGCQIAIDDFGTGYSNFVYLFKLHVDYIKIDGSLIKDVIDSKESQLLISFIVDFSHKMGIKTIAEFVENEQMYIKLKELGVDYSQGYYFAKPARELPPLGHPL